MPILVYFIFSHPDCTVGAGVSPARLLRVRGLYRRYGITPFPKDIFLEAVTFGKTKKIRNIINIKFKQHKPQRMIYKVEILSDFIFIGFFLPPFRWLDVPLYASRHRERRFLPKSA